MPSTNSGNFWSDRINTLSDQFEARVHGRIGPEPTTGLRARVLRAVDDELAKSRAIKHSQTDNFYWPAIAAAAVILLGLSWMCASQDVFSVRSGDAKQIVWELHAIRHFEAQQEGTFR